MTPEKRLRAASISCLLPAGSPRSFQGMDNANLRSRRNGGVVGQAVEPGGAGGAYR